MKARGKRCELRAYDRVLVEFTMRADDFGEVSVRIDGVDLSARWLLPLPLAAQLVDGQPLRLCRTRGAGAGAGCPLALFHLQYDGCQKAAGSFPSLHAPSACMLGREEKRRFAVRPGRVSRAKRAAKVR